MGILNVGVHRLQNGPGTIVPLSQAIQGLPILAMMLDENVASIAIIPEKREKEGREEEKREKSTAREKGMEKRMEVRSGSETATR